MEEHQSQDLPTNLHLQREPLVVELELAPKHCHRPVVLVEQRELEPATIQRPKMDRRQGQEPELGQGILVVEEELERTVGLVAAKEPRHLPCLVVVAAAEVLQKDLHTVPFAAEEAVAAVVVEKAEQSN